LYTLYGGKIIDYIIPISEARGKLPELIKKIAAIGKHLIITRNGRAAVVMISPEELETLEIKTNPELLRAIIRGEEDMEAGKLYSHKDVFKDV
jgi:prevent-host-death family protein